MGKVRVAVLFGGKSGEHEISLRSAASVMERLDRGRFEVLPVFIDKSGHWRVGDPVLPGADSVALGSKASREVVLPPIWHESEKGGVALLSTDTRERAAQFDVAFPVMHGPLCEDGSIQGFLELANVPYVGSGVLGSAVCMDKDVAKRLASAAGIPVADFCVIKLHGWKNQREQTLSTSEKKLGYPIFVKPANLGSSVGISKAKSREDLVKAIEEAFSYDEKVVLEKFIDAREIEFAVLSDLDPAKGPHVSIAGEIIPKHEFYSYEAKYLDENGAEFVIPANLTSAKLREGQELVRRCFEVLECDGMGRVDFFLEKRTNKYFFNEINTIPGFTSISMYPKMWEASGVSYAELLTRLIDLAIARHARRQKLGRDWKG